LHLLLNLLFKMQSEWSVKDNVNFSNNSDDSEDLCAKVT
jgi:hypothetical protein